MQMQTQTVKLLSIAEIQKTAFNNSYVGVSPMHLEKTGYNIAKAYFLSLLISSWIFYTENGKAENQTFYACEKYLEKRTGLSAKTQYTYFKEFKAKGWITLSIIDKKRHVGFTAEFAAEFSVFLASISGKFTDVYRENLPTEPVKFTYVYRENLPPNNKEVNNSKNKKNAKARKSARAGKDFFGQKNTPVSTDENPSKKVPLKKVSPVVEAALPLAFNFFEGWLAKLGKYAPAQTDDEVLGMITVLEFFEKRQEAFHAAKGTVPTAQGLVSAMATCFDTLLLSRVEAVDKKGVKQRQVSLGEKGNTDIDFFLGCNHVVAFANQISLVASLATEIYKKAAAKSQKQQQAANIQTAPKTERASKSVPPPARPVEAVVVEAAVEEPATTNPPKDVKEWLDNIQADEEQERAQIAEQISALGIDYSKKQDVKFIEYSTALSQICNVGEFLAYAVNESLLEEIPAALSKHKGSRSHNPLDYYKILIGIYNGKNK